MSAADLEAQVAQSVEQRTENPRVGGSIPPLGTTISLLTFFINIILINSSSLSLR